MNRNTLAAFIVGSLLVVAFVLGDGPLPWHMNKAEVVQLLALEDGTALVTQQGDAGAFLGRVRPDGSRLWMTRIPGDISTRAFVSNAGKIAVRYATKDDCGVAAYSIDGQLLWQHILFGRMPDGQCVAPELANAVFANDIVAVWVPHGVIGLSISDGAQQWRQGRPGRDAAYLLPDGTIAIDNDHGRFVLDPHTGNVSERRGCQLGPERIVLHEGAAHDEVLGDRGFASTLPFRSDPDERSELIGCATYRNQIALLVRRTGDVSETRLVLADRAGFVLADRHLPLIEGVVDDLMGFVPAERISFAGELPRVVPLVVDHTYESTPILVDIETGTVVARGSTDRGFHAVRDGEAAYFVSSASHALLSLAPGDHLVHVLAASRWGSFDAAQIGGGYVWTFIHGKGRLDKPAITATPAQPRRV